MYKNTIKINVISILIITSLMLLCLTIALNSNLVSISANALEDEYSATTNEFGDFANVGPFASDKKDKEEPNGIIK